MLAQPSAPLVRLAVRAYPREWRRRYGVEIRSLVLDRQVSWADLFDLFRGAFDARLHPHIQPRPAFAAILTRGVPIPAPTRPAYGAVPSAPLAVQTRRIFLRRMLAAGIGIVSLEFLGGTLAFLWPQIRGGLGGKIAVGTIADIGAKQPDFATGWPYSYPPARAFLINVPAAEALALGHPISMPNPTADQLLALWRKCPHLGCQVPELCDELKRFTCRCHGSTYNILGEKLKNGPATRGMDRFAVSIGADGVVVIDSSQITTGALERGPEHLVFTDPHPWDALCPY